MKFLQEYKRKVLFLGLLGTIAFIGFIIFSYNTKDPIIFNEYLYNYKEQKFQTFKSDKNGNQRSYIDYWDTTDNQFQYYFKEYDNVFTNGNSISNNFSIIDTSKDNISDLLTLNNKNQAIFPLTKDKRENLYFSLITYKNDGTDSREIFKYDKQENQLIDLNLYIDHLMDACIIGSILYFTCYNEKAENYDLYQTPLDGDKKISLVKEGLDTYEIYNLNNELFFKTPKNELESYKSNKVYPAGDITINYKEYLINLVVGEDSTQDLNLYSISKEENVYKKSSIISFSIQDDQLLIYTFDSVSKFNLN